MSGGVSDVAGRGGEGVRAGAGHADTPPDVSLHEPVYTEVCQLKLKYNRNQQHYLRA